MKFESWNYVRTIEAVRTLTEESNALCFDMVTKPLRTRFGTLRFKSDMYDSQVAKIKACDDQF